MSSVPTMAMVPSPLLGGWVERLPIGPGCRELRSWRPGSRGPPLLLLPAPSALPWPIPASSSKAQQCWLQWWSSWSVVVVSQQELLSPPWDRENFTAVYSTADSEREICCVLCFTYWGDVKKWLISAQFYNGMTNVYQIMKMVPHRTNFTMHNLCLFI